MEAIFSRCSFENMIDDAEMLLAALGVAVLGLINRGTFCFM
jgi:hypothetical protein